MTHGSGQRLDKWLWSARLFRTRQAAASYVSERSVRIVRNNRVQRTEKPGFALRLGDEIAFLLGERMVVVRVLGFSERRGSAADAAALLERLECP